MKPGILGNPGHTLQGHPMNPRFTRPPLMSVPLPPQAPPPTTSARGPPPLLQGIRSTMQANNPNLSSTSSSSSLPPHPPAPAASSLTSSSSAMDPLAMFRQNLSKGLPMNVIKSPLLLLFHYPASCNSNIILCKRKLTIKLHGTFIYKIIKSISILVTD